MSNFKHPQYLTANGLVRMEKIPNRKPLLSASSAKTGSEIPSILGTAKPAPKNAPTRLRLLAEKRVLAKKILERREKGLSEEAAKAIAEAIKTLLRS
jgi:hypothetical protein